MLESIRSFVYQIRVIDTHEHFWDESWRLQNPGDFASLFWHYGQQALQSAGLTQAEDDLLFGKNASHDEKWAILSRYWPLVRHTAAMQAVIWGLRDIYGVEEPYTCENMRTLTQKIREKVKPGFYRYVLNDLAGIDYCYVCCFDHDELDNRHIARTWGDMDLMRADFTADRLLTGRCLDSLEKQTGIRPDTFALYEEAFRKTCDELLPLCADIKVGLAYDDGLDFSAPLDFAAAQAEYTQNKKTPLPFREIPSMRSYLMNLLAQKAAQYNKPFKFHTGILCGQYSRTHEDLQNIALFALKHPENRFAVMHMAYPHQNEIPAATANIPNLYADLSWAWTLDPYAAKQLVKQLIYAVPIHKIMAYGGDYSLPENTYGNLLQARNMLSAALDEMIYEGALTREAAEDAAMWLLRKSALRFYGETQ